MNRHRLVSLVLFSLTFLLMLSNGQPLMAAAFKKPHPIKLPKGKAVILAHQYVATLNLRDCVPAKPVQGTGIGGFGCSTIYAIDLNVSKTDNKVRVNPATLRGLRPGDCIQWRTTSDDGVPALITSINFLDNAAEAAAAGKPSTTVSTFPVGADLCTVPARSCVVSVALADGWYRYEANVKHGTTPKKADPEVVVECGMSCGDPEDLPPI